MNAKAVLYDLGISLVAVSGWLIPSSAQLDVVKALSISTSVVFSARAYYTGIMLLSKERRNDEKEGIIYEAETDFYDQLISSQIESFLEVKSIEIETNTIKKLIPLLAQKRVLERELEQVSPSHPELSDEDREQAAKSAIEGVFSTPAKPQEVTEEDMRKLFPESMDSTSWKAILKALQSSSTKEEIIRDVLGCQGQQQVIGLAYFDYLKSKFLG